MNSVIEIVYVLLQVQKKRRIVAKVHCRNIKNECPKPSCDEPVLYPGRCCKVCPGDVNSECYFAVSLAAAYRAGVCPGHTNVLGATSVIDYVGLECVLVTLMFLVPRRGVFI